MNDVFDTTLSFKDLGLDDRLLRAIEGMGFEHPTAVQSKLIPVAITGKDVLGQSKTGTGKTAAFGLPILQVLLAAELAAGGQSNPDPDEKAAWEADEEDDGPPNAAPQAGGRRRGRGRKPTKGTGREPAAFAALVLTPTRELAIQVAHELRNLGRHTHLKVLPIYGGQRISAQAEKLKRDPQVIVGTPGRVMDMHRRGMLPYDKLQITVLDEVDRMLDIGFRDDIRRILGSIRQKHQTMFVSATISGEIERLARQYLTDPEKLVLTSSSLTVTQVEQHYFPVERWDKNRLLVHLLKHEDPELALVFCRTKSTVDGLADYLTRKKIDAHAIHGDMYQGKRNRIMTKLRDGELRVLVASDLAARGLDVDDISHVINYDVPEDPEVYVHRIGRTARAGRKGIAWSFVTPDQGDLLTNIELLTNVEIGQADFKEFEPGAVPRDVVAQRQRDDERRETARTDNARLASSPPSAKDARDASKFPGGIVPAGAPAKRMGGRLRSRRR